ncbi:MAG TPA: FCD domain-containing protein [Acidimicrobiales bacterium]|nr:FCD domain-containing protein [Acidimicrobiales bacterium]
MVERDGVTVLRARDLAATILDRVGADGSSRRLPTERQLAEDLGVTRTAVRNALGLLEAEGRISREVGRGTFLAGGPGTDSWPPPGSPHGGRATDGAPADDIAPAHVMAARRLIEPRLVPLVVPWATERDFQELDRCLAGGDGAQTIDEFEAWDIALHRAIVQASHNEVVVRMYRAVEDAREGRIWGNLKRRSDSVERRAARQREHHALVGALRARDVDAAVAAMEHHLERVESAMLGRARQPDLEAIGR